jgi:transposase
VIFVGVDWAEAHHEVCVLDQAGAVLGRRRVPDGVAGVARLHGLIADHASEPSQVMVGIELDRGLLVGALTAAGYQVVAVNPLAASRYRERHGTSGAKSDRGDAKVLADLVRTDRHNHRPVAGDSDLAEAIRVLARAHQSAIWSRQRQLNSLRSALRAFYPAALDAFGTDLASGDAVAVLTLAPTPERGRQLSRAQIAAALRRGGRQRNLAQRAAPIQATLRAPQLAAPQPLSQAYGVVAQAAVGLLASLNQQITSLEEALGEGFNRHPDADTIHSLPGLGMVLGARVLGEFGDDQTRYPRPSLARTTPAAHPSPRPRAAHWSSWPATPATAAWPMPWSSGRSAPSPSQPALAATTTSSGPATRPTAKPCGSSPTAGSASSTPAWTAASSTTNTSPGATTSPRPLDTFQPWDV